MKRKFNSLLFVCCVALMAFTDGHVQKLKIAIVPIGKTNPAHIAVVKQSLENFYEAKVSTALELPIDSSILTKRPLGRTIKATFTLQVLGAEEINRKLAQQGLANYDILLGITDSALVIGGELGAIDMQGLNRKLIRGLAERDLQVAAISTYKLKIEAKDEQAFKESLSKVAKHETGHILGAQHCEKRAHCLMVDGYKFDLATHNFCQECLGKFDQKYLKR